MNPLDNNSKGFSRRNFMKKSSLAIGAVTALSPGMGLAGWFEDWLNGGLLTSSHKSHTFTYVRGGDSWIIGGWSYWGWSCTGCTAKSDWNQVNW